MVFFLSTLLVNACTLVCLFDKKETYEIVKQNCIDLKIVNSIKPIHDELRKRRHLKSFVQCSIKPDCIEKNLFLENLPKCFEDLKHSIDFEFQFEFPLPMQSTLNLSKEQINIKFSCSSNFKDVKVDECLNKISFFNISKKTRKKRENYYSAISCLTDPKSIVSVMSFLLSKECIIQLGKTTTIITRAFDFDETLPSSTPDSIVIREEENQEVRVETVNTYYTEARCKEKKTGKRFYINEIFLNNGPVLLKDSFIEFKLERQHLKESTSLQGYKIVGLSNEFHRKYLSIDLYINLHNHHVNENSFFVVCGPDVKKDAI